ncbi:hypothetical protein [Fictibacillus arsenicus]|uniref:Uncharacterized protein n=1 Tax=Fictibacillus arsenicus TaxID=255247 RepID=A0A1V3GC89_9BACL|nr:hypothetical protein [Fictibacillus arsenicus]OOE14455.1 hypothetical protein UN64_04480 [Fictibacillus arsenicus]
MRRFIEINAVVSSIIGVFYQFFYWDLIKNDPMQLLVFFLKYVVYGYFTIVAIVLVFLFFRGKILKIPIIIQSIALAVLLFVPLSEARVKLDYFINKSDREKVVEMIANSKYKSTGRNQEMNLPASYKHVSSGGKVQYLKKENEYFIKFTIYATFWGESAYIFSSSQENLDKEPYYLDEMNSEKLEAHWFFFSDFNHQYWPDNN